MTELSSESGIEPGLVIGERYRVVERIGEGAMGTVYRVEHTEMGTQMALKLLKRDLLLVPSIEERFNREARSAASLDDPHIVRVTDFGRAPDSSLFMVMELLDGVSLGEAAGQGALTLVELIEAIAQVLSALEHAHDHGIIHRDLKPENIMLVERRGKRVVKILDFGLAKLTEASSGGQALTQAGTVFGTPRYMSPEQATGEAVDGRADLYAVGVILYELLTGRALFDGETIPEILTKHITQAPAPLELQPEQGLNAAMLEAVVLKALAKDKKERFQDAGAFRGALLGTGTEGRTPSGVDREVDGRAADGAAADPPTAGQLAADPLAAVPSAMGFAPTVVREDSVSGVHLTTPTRRVGRRAVLGALALVGVGAAGVFVAASLVGTPPTAAVEEALAKGELGKAYDRARVLVSERPDDEQAWLLKGHVSYMQDDLEAAGEDYVKAIQLDGYAAIDERFQNHVREMVEKKAKKGLAPIVIALSKKGDLGAAELMQFIAEKAHTHNLRRKAYEGLERVGEDDRLDRFEYLKKHLAKNKTDKCKVRRWYVKRLIALDDDRALPILKRERARKGGFLDLERTGGCMKEMLDKAIGD